MGRSTSDLLPVHDVWYGVYSTMWQVSAFAGGAHVSLMTRVESSTTSMSHAVVHIYTHCIVRVYVRVGMWAGSL